MDLDSTEQAGRLARWRANLMEARRFVRVDPEMVSAAIYAVAAEMESAACDLDKAARAKQYDALMTPTPGRPGFVPLPAQGSPLPPTVDWRDRLVFDFEVSDVSPVIKGTWITVGHVISLIVDGWSWSDILRSHPELSEDDIQVCCTYAINEEENAES